MEASNQSLTNRLSRILVIRMRRLGDVVLSTALLADLRKALPNAVIDVLVNQQFSPLLQNHPAPTNIMPYDGGRSLATLLELRHKRYDTVIDLQANMRTMLISMFSGARLRLGWKVAALPGAYTAVLDRNQLPKVFVADEHKRFLGMIGIPAAGNAPKLYVTDQELHEAESFLRTKNINTHRRWIGLHLSAVNQAKCWPLQNFEALAHILLEAGFQPIVFGLPNDVAALKLCQKVPQVIDALSSDLRIFLARLSTCKAFVSSDTGPAHAATALEVPRITIFSSADPINWAPPIETVISMRGSGTNPSPSDISVEQVFRGIKKLVGDTE